jgi:hypothetical protein
MAIIINQQPLYTVLPVGQPIMFSVSQDTLVATKFKVKFIAEVYVSEYPIAFSATELIGRFKTTPNNAGRGMFDLRPILETFLSPDHEPSEFAEYKESQSTADTFPFPLHLIDKFSMNKTSVRFFAVIFKMEYAETTTGAVVESSQLGTSNEYLMFNGIFPNDEPMTWHYNKFGYFMGRDTSSGIGGNYFPGNVEANFLTKSPKVQYARLTDYGTLPFLNFLNLTTAVNDESYIQWMQIKYYTTGGVYISQEIILQNQANGGTSNYSSSQPDHSIADLKLMYFGAFPANLRGSSTMFQNLVTLGTVGSYIIYPYYKNLAAYSTNPVTIKIICPNEKGYEGIRLTWLNSWGTWDYYTFNMKSTKSLTTNKSAWTQLEGTWNENVYHLDSYRGGKKNFRVNATEKIRINTDFVTEEESAWFEELINSPEVYIVNEYADDEPKTIANKYIEPVTLLTSSYIKKTMANDKLMQYTIEIEKSKTKRTQAV